MQQFHFQLDDQAFPMALFLALRVWRYVLGPQLGGQWQVAPVCLAWGPMRCGITACCLCLAGRQSYSTGLLVQPGVELETKSGVRTVLTQ